MGKKRGHIPIVTDPDLVVTKGGDLDLYKQTAIVKDGSDTKKLFFLPGEQYNKLHGKRGGDGEEGMNPVEKAKAKGKDLLSKGKNLFKKKNKKDKE